MIFNIIHYFVNIFAGGLSETKTFLFLLYIILIFSLYFVSKNIKLKNYKWIWIGVATLSMYCYGFLLQIIFFVSNNLKLSEHIYTINNGEISNSVFYHTHIAKGVLGQIFSFFGKGQLSSVDAGGAYVGFFHPWVFIIGFVFLTFLIIQVVYYFVASFKIFLIEKNKRQKFFYILGYAIISFSLVKTSIDGGIFHQCFLPGIMVIILFYFREKNKLKINYNMFFIIISILLITLLVIGYNKLSIAILLSGVSLSLLYLIILCLTERKINIKISSLFLFLFLITLFFSSQNDMEIFRYSRIKLKEGSRFYIYDEFNKEIKILKTSKEININNLSEKFNKNINYEPISVPGITCRNFSRFSEGEMTLVTDSPVLTNFSKVSPFILIKKQESTASLNRWMTKLDVLVDPCVPEMMTFISGEIQKNGISKFILIFK